MHALPIMVVTLCVLTIAYRFYSAFIAAKVLALDDARPTPAHRLADGKDYVATNKWVLFGHHFAAISGAGPLIGPVLAIQFGYLPGLIWLVVGVCLAGAVQDMMVLTLSVRRGGRSLASIAREELGPVAGGATAVAILYVIIIALAGLGIVVVKALGGEQVPMPAGTSLTFPKNADFNSSFDVRSNQTTYEVVPGSLYRYGAKPGDVLTFAEGFRLTTPGLNPLSKTRDEGGARVLPEGARRLVPGSSWGTFTIACTIPIALVVGLYMYRVRKGKVVEASLIGAIGVLAATVAGASIPGSPWEKAFSLSREQTIYFIAAYGFVASVLPVWLLLCPRDYISSFLKIGTIALLVVGVIVANPKLEAPAINPQFAHGGGPYFQGGIFPYVFICIMCGAISGFHALVASGTTPKMVDKESQVRMIGYGAMLMEGLVGIVALIAAASLPNSMYYDINIDLSQKPKYTQALKVLGADHDGDASELVSMEKEVGESLHGRTGGAVTLAVGMARIFTRAVPGLSGWTKYWYHFAIMFEALFILTTIDTGTRIGRFLVQEFLGKLWKPLGNLDWPPAAYLATALVVFGWSYFIYTGTVATIWPMFGMANQLLALTALVIVTTSLVNAGKTRYVWVTLPPALFVATTTLTTAYFEVTGTYWGWVKSGDLLKGWLNIGLTGMLVGCVGVIVAAAVGRCVVRARVEPRGPVTPA
jgi:carbon starvation protein